MNVSPGESSDANALVDLAEDAPAADPRRARSPPATGAYHSDFKQRVFDDGADVEPVLLGETRVRQSQAAVVGGFQPRETLVVAQRVAAGRDEVDRAIEVGACEVGIGQGRAHLGEQFIGAERPRARHAEDVLREDIDGAAAMDDGVLFAGERCFERGAAFQHFEAIGRDENGVRRLVEAVVGAADALDQAGRALRRAEMDDEIDVAPVDAEVERRRRDDGAQIAARHGGFNLAPLGDIERTVMERDRQALRVRLPQLLEHQLGLHPRVHEHQRQAMARDRGEYVRHRIARRVARDRHSLLGFEDLDVRPGAAADRDDVGEPDRRLGRCLLGEPRTQLARMGNSGRKSDRHQPRRQRAQPRDVERQQIAALRRRQRVEFVENDRVEIAEQVASVGAREQERDLLRRRQQDLGRRQTLALALAWRRVAGAGLDADVEAHLGDRA